MRHKRSTVFSAEGEKLFIIIFKFSNQNKRRV